MSLKHITSFIILFICGLLLFAQSKGQPMQHFEITCKTPSGEVVKDEDVLIYSLRLKKSKLVTTDSNGQFEIDLPRGWWEFHATKFGIKQQIGTDLYKKFYVVDNPPHGVYKEQKFTFTYVWDKDLRIDVNFDSKKYSIKEESYPVLDKIVEYMKRKPKLKIEVKGHTDATGSSSENLTLSQNRAKAVKDYLVSKGVDEDRIKSVGYGDTMPLHDNQTEEGKADNRRTEISIID